MYFSGSSGLVLFHMKPCRAFSLLISSRASSLYPVVLLGLRPPWGPVVPLPFGVVVIPSRLSLGFLYSSPPCSVLLVGIGLVKIQSLVLRTKASNGNLVTPCYVPALSAVLPMLIPLALTIKLQGRHSCVCACVCGNKYI